jgi:hypothetical protein
LGAAWGAQAPTSKFSQLKPGLSVIKGDKYRVIYLVGGLEHDFYFFDSVGNVIIPTDELIFFRGVG